LTRRRKAVWEIRDCVSEKELEKLTFPMCCNLKQFAVPVFLDFNYEAHIALAYKFDTSATATLILSQVRILWRLMGNYQHSVPYFTAHAKIPKFVSFLLKFERHQ